MSTYSYGRRRRRILVTQTGPLRSAAAASTVQPPRPVLAKNFRLPVRPTRVLILRTPQLHGAFQGARPPILVVRPQSPRRFSQPIITRTRPLPNIPPPTQRWQPRPLIVPDYTRQGRWRPILARTGPIRFPSPAMPAAPRVGAWRAGPPAALPKLFRTALPARSQSVTPLPRALTVRLPVILWRVRPVVTIRSNPQAQARPVPRSVLPTPLAIVRLRPAMPWRNYIVSIRSELISQRQNRPARATIVPIQPRIIPIRPSIIRTSGAGSILRSQTKPLIVPRPALRIWPQPVRPAARYSLASPAVHGPMPRPLIVGLPRLFSFRALASYKSITAFSKYPTGGQGGGGAVIPPGGSAVPPDLVAAVIAWIRQQPALVSAFGDSPTTQKFGSDLAAPKTGYPYLNFFEPDEDESYETADQTGLVSSVADGTLALEIVASGKLQVRQLSEQVAAVINNAPLTFADGNLIYLYRTTRKFPTVTGTGPGTNVVVFKRYLEFDYKIERWAPVL
jgi:hypothetical protein